MTSKLKCPVCQNNLHKINMVVSTCTNDKCKLWGASIPNLVLEALTQAKQDLEIATKAMNQVMSMGAKNNICYHLKAKTVKSILGNALEQIEHKE